MRADARRGPPAPGLYHAALYMRLSKDDDGTLESASIATQRKMLRTYADENAYTIAGEYIDDGWSGTNFDRPDFKRMIADIEARKINMVITKDFSRLGRDYITAGQYTEMYFPEHNVRYIAINDGYDSTNPFNDIAPFKHVINEMYARDTSKKIRSAFQTKMLEGSYIGNFAPYGYKKDPDNKNHLIIDYEAAAVVREIFQMAVAGNRPSEIAAQLNQSGIASPVMYRCRARPNLDPNSYTTRREWTPSTICKLLANVVYLGHTAQGKTSKPSFKSKTAFRKPRDEWYIVENTHEPLVTQDMFDLVRKRSVSRRNEPKTGFQNVFSGIAKCADCGGNMSTTGSRKKGSPYNLVCGRYKLYGSKECSNHFIDYELLYQSVLSEVKEMLKLSEKDKKQVLADMEKARRSEKANETDHEMVKLLKTLKARDEELDALIRRLYEDNVSGKISDERFTKLNAAYEAEQRQVGQKIKLLKKPAVEETSDKESRRRFMELLDGLADISELTPNLVKRLIDRVEVGQGGYEQTPEGKKKRQTVRIFWRFVGELSA
ncbi:Site-specific DNA recombinase [Sporobacter termitidis DSM 10068]|uniref:Site-specific DNA recombinase n=1 Tax=Sporobacter termitidis DSM 10068 TaxID=1123282 RepID=A0A1M5YFX9_9FIRM|nr:recombinase family protein [Sporobacter termitidis]SHI10413.1 Site-specific DNA recombinase [Sporobacter termitidis DSM 10068]